METPETTSEWEADQMLPKGLDEYPITDSISDTLQLFSNSQSFSYLDAKRDSEHELDSASNCMFESLQVKEPIVNDSATNEDDIKCTSPRDAQPDSPPSVSFNPEGDSSDVSEQVDTTQSGTNVSDSLQLVSYSFNQDYSCFACATSAGFRVISCCPLTECIRRETPICNDGKFKIVRMLFRSNIFVLLSATDDRKVKLWDDQRRKFIGELRCRQSVKNICLCREILTMVTEHTIYIYQTEEMRPVNIIQTGANPLGICVVSSGTNADEWKLACPAIQVGAVRLLSSAGTSLSCVFQAHRAHIAAMAFNSLGSLLATASTVGTFIRVFDAVNGQLLHELRRGSLSHSISCMAFRPDNLFLAVASSSSTVHIFKLVNSGNIAGTDGLSRSRSDSINSASEFGSTDLLETVSSAAGSTISTSTVIPAPTTNEAPTSPNSESPKNPNALNQVTDISAPIGKQSVHSINSWRGISSAVYDTSKDIVNDALKGVLPRPLTAVRSFAQFHIPSDHQSMDIRSDKSSIVGPLCAFAGGKSNHLYLLHYNGVFYECRFEPNHGSECTLLNATTWISPRTDFHIQSHIATEVLHSELEGGHDGDDWQIVM